MAVVLILIVAYWAPGTGCWVLGTGYWVLGTAILPWMPVLPVSFHGFDHEAKQWEVEKENGSK